MEDAAVQFIQEPAGNLSAHAEKGFLQNFQQPFEVLPVVHVREGGRRYREERPAAVLQQLKGIPGIIGSLQCRQEADLSEFLRLPAGKGGIGGDPGGEDLVLHRAQKPTVSGCPDTGVPVQVVPDHAGHRADALGAGALGETFQQRQDFLQLGKVARFGTGVRTDAPEFRKLVQEAHDLGRQCFRMAVLDVLGDVDDLLAEFLPHPKIGFDPVREGGMGGEGVPHTPQGHERVCLPVRGKEVVQVLGEFRVLFDVQHGVRLLSDLKLENKSTVQAVKRATRCAESNAKGAEQPPG